MRFSPRALLSIRRLGVVPTRYALQVTVSEQRAALFERNVIPHYTHVRTYRCSTSRFGVGQQAGSNRTPLGLHRIAEKIGGGWPPGTVFKARQPVGFTWAGLPNATITTRILWLEGLEPGFNRGGDVDSHARYIYIHGTGDETTLGRPASCGCVHLAAHDLIPLFDRLPSGTLVWIEV
ncbi:MAG TPA: L,D-transpeptidase [Verrucomicrobia bacterium]|nr:L,D-transpeptidase [Verrucomicrobiota bacterium]HOB31625.1 L,D-transpeptidase [Verrucomicrobiota bacterium]HOP96097.1 L,D-transpeptidase [Verrucomicrobiota bacterium]